MIRPRPCRVCGVAFTPSPGGPARICSPWCRTTEARQRAVLSPELKVLHTQETGSLETPDKAKPGHDHAKVLEFLRTQAK